MEIASRIVIKFAYVNFLQYLCIVFFNSKPLQALSQPFQVLNQPFQVSSQKFTIFKIPSQLLSQPFLVLVTLIFEPSVRDKLVVAQRFVDSYNTFPIPSIYFLECLCYLLPSASTKKQFIFLSINSLFCKSYASKCKSSKTKIEWSSDTSILLNVLLISIL